MGAQDLIGRIEIAKGVLSDTAKQNSAEITIFPHFRVTGELVFSFSHVHGCFPTLDHACIQHEPWLQQGSTRKSTNVLFSDQRLGLQEIIEKRRLCLIAASAMPVSVLT